MKKTLKEKITLIFVITLIIIAKGVISIAVEDNEFIAKTYIDSPSSIESCTGKINVTGWTMTNDKQATVKIYVDGEERKILSEVREERNDVLNAINGYGTVEQNPTPGFNYTIDSDGIEREKQHEIIVKVFSRENKEIAVHKQQFFYEEYKAKLYIDFPSKENNEVEKENNINGWIMTNDEKATIKVYVNEEEQKINNIKREERTDVLNAIKGYGTEKQNPTPGFNFSLDAEKFKDGTYKLKIQIISQEGKNIAETTKEIIINKNKAKIYIDSPNNNIVVKELNVRGWAMTNDNQATIKAYIDGKEKNILSQTKEERPDVLSAIIGYGTPEQNQMPGFNYTIDTQGIEAEKHHELEIKIYSKENEEMAIHKSSFYYEDYKAKTYIDFPSNNKTAGDIIVAGWVMTNDEQSKIKIYVDGEERNIISENREIREDVRNAIKGYGTKEQNLMPGFNYILDTKDLENGEHEVTIEIFSRENNLLATNTKKFYLEDSKAKMYLDTPSAKENIILKTGTISGWNMSNDANTSIKAYIDNQEQEIINLKRTPRSDVIKAVNGYGTEKENPTPGFEISLNIENIENGTHTLKIETISSKGDVISIIERNVITERYNTKIYIDQPIENEKIKDMLYIDGWLMSEGENSKVEIYIDDIKQENIEIKRKERADVINVIKGYGTEKENPTPGFETNVDTSNLLDGYHKLTIKVMFGEEQSIATKEVKFLLKKHDTKITIDKPSRNRHIIGKIDIAGWVMSELYDKKVTIKFDNDIIQNVNIVPREDVLNAIKNYGGSENNPTPGFEATIDTSKYSAGEHTITIQVHSNKMNEVIEEKTIKIQLLNKIQREIITYGYSGAYIKGIAGGSELTCYKFGSGPNVLFATFCLHGYEDSWARDGEVLVTIANNFYDRLIAEQDLDIADKWTIYIFPEVNPDGRRLGNTSNGKGRTTLYSKIGKGIDLNRCWQIDDNYIRYTNTRNYNGTKGFQAYEAEYLRDFLLSHKSTNGKTVVVDLHGWLNQLIGDEEICKYYQQQYKTCEESYGRYGEQYLISWAKAILGAQVALVELPEAQNWNEVNNMQLSNKFIDATLNMLREI